MDPVEVGTFLRVGCWSEGGSDWLDETNCSGDNSEDRMGIVRLRPPPDLHEDDDKGGHGQQPRENHADAMPGKPLILSAQLTAHPGLLEIPRQQDSNWRCANPGDNHECTVQAQQQHTASTHVAHFGQGQGSRRSLSSDVVVGHGVVA